MFVYTAEKVEEVCLERFCCVFDIRRNGCRPCCAGGEGEGGESACERSDWYGGSCGCQAIVCDQRCH